MQYLKLKIKKTLKKNFREVEYSIFDAIEK